MNDRRRAARILAMQSLCQLEAMPRDFLTQLNDFLADEAPPESIQRYARELVLSAREQLDAINAEIQAVSPNWDVRRMSIVDRNILRVALAEMGHESAAPQKVVIDEAIEIAKQFGAVESPGFVNAILDAVVKHRSGKGSSDASPTALANDAAQP